MLLSWEARGVVLVGFGTCGLALRRLHQYVCVVGAFVGPEARPKGSPTVATVYVWNVSGCCVVWWVSSHLGVSGSRRKGSPIAKEKIFLLVVCVDDVVIPLMFFDERREHRRWQSAVDVDAGGIPTNLICAEVSFELILEAYAQSLEATTVRQGWSHS